MSGSPINRAARAIAIVVVFVAIPAAIGGAVVSAGLAPSWIAGLVTIVSAIVGVAVAMDDRRRRSSNL
jgi:hypothetical protein